MTILPPRRKGEALQPPIRVKFARTQSFTASQSHKQAGLHVPIREGVRNGQQHELSTPVRNWTGCQFALLLRTPASEDTKKKQLQA
ncbi:hypothetical protein Q7P37_011125 [Cladosporium fusiforme]